MEDVRSLIYFPIYRDAKHIYSRQHGLEQPWEASDNKNHCHVYVECARSEQRKAGVFLPTGLDKGQ